MGDPRKRRWLRSATGAVLAAIALGGVVAACGDDGDDSADTTVAAETTAAPETTAPELVEPISSIDEIEPLAEPVDMTLFFSPQGPQLLPVWWAIDQGWFEQVGLNITTEEGRGGSLVQDVVRLAQGDVDMMHTTLSPGLYNQRAEGFDISVVASASIPREGRFNDLWLTVLPELENEITELSDLAGHTIEAGEEGTNTDLLARAALQAGGLEEGEAEITYRVSQPPDFLTLAQQKAADVFVLFEPFATLAESQGLVKKWMTYGDGELAPWYQPSVLAVSDQFASENPEAIQKFLEVYVFASRAINEFEGEWDPEALRVTTQYVTLLPPDMLVSQGPLLYFEPNGEVSLEAVEKTQQTWIDMEMIPTEVPPDELVDTTFLEAALTQVGRFED